MEFVHTTYNEILASYDAKTISDILVDSRLLSPKYSIDSFFQQLASFVKANESLLSLDGTYKEKWKKDYQYPDNKDKATFLKSVAFLSSHSPYIFSNLIADILLLKGLEDNRSNLDRPTDREGTTAGMFDHSLVDKSELMFL